MKKLIILALVCIPGLSCKPAQSDPGPPTIDGKSGIEWYLKGNKVYRKGDFESALNFYSKALKLEPQNAKFYNNRGTVYQQQHNYLAATSDYTKAIELYPRFPQAYRNRGTAYLAQGMYKFAIADWEKACKLGLSAMCDYLKYHGVSSKDDF